MLLCNISSDKVHICDASGEAFLDRNGIEKVLGPALLDWWDKNPFDQVLVINGPGGFTNLRVGSLTRNLVAHLLGLRKQTVTFFSCTKIEFYRYFVKKGILPTIGYIYLGQKNSFWKYDFEKDSYQVVPQDTHFESDSFCDYVNDEIYWKGGTMVRMGMDGNGCFLVWNDVKHIVSIDDLGLKSVPFLEAQYLVEL